MNKVLSTDEVKEAELNILLYFKSVCEENGLKYYLHGGTLIGALRHHGFIPWDDDIDVAMPREDYQKFIAITQNSDNQYKVLNADSNDQYYYAFAKMTDTTTTVVNNNEKTKYGVFIDVFPIDEIPTPGIIRKIYFTKAYVYKIILMHLNEQEKKRDRNIVKIVLRFLVNQFNHHKILKKFDSLTQPYPKSQQVSTITTGSQWDISYEKSWFSDQVSVEFEGYHFPAPIGYDELLRKYFGNYMTLPPKEKQVAHGYTYLLRSGDVTNDKKIQ